MIVQTVVKSLLKARDGKDEGKETSFRFIAATSPQIIQYRVLERKGE